MIMKVFKIFFLTMIITINLSAQIGADPINAIWKTAAKDAEISIYKEGEYYFGKITWMKEPGKDTKNPKAELRSRDLMGAVILSNFVFNGKDKWEDGRIYDPSGGKTYSCTMKLKNNNILEIRGYIGISLLGRTEKWTKK